MNEEGGELAFLPSGTAILPADRSEQLLDNVVNNVVNNEEQNRQLSFAPIIQIEVNGQLSEEMIAKLKEMLQDLFPELYRQMQEEDYANRSLQQGFA